MARSEQPLRRRSVVVAVAVIIAAAACTQAREFRQRRNNILQNNVPDTLTVPDTTQIDNALLKDVSADKFLSLWFIFVLAGPTKHTERPWTLLVPLNTGLPGPGSEGFLSDKETTKALLLNHVLMGTSLTDEDLLADREYITEGGTPLFFTRDQGETYVNDIKVVGEPIQVAGGGGTVYIIEQFLPIHASANEVLADAPVKPAPEAQNTPQPTTAATTTTTSTEKAPVLEGTTKFASKRRLSERERPSPLRKSQRAGELSATNGDAPSSSGGTRFDKFKNRNKETEQEEILTKPTQSSLFADIALGSLLSTPASVTLESTTTPSLSDQETTEGELLLEYTYEPDLVEDTTSASPSSVPDIFAAFANAINSKRSPEESSSASNFVSETSDTFEPETEAPFLAFEKFVKTAINGDLFFSESNSESESPSTTETNDAVVPDQTEPAEIDSEREFFPESDFVPFNEFLNSQTATEKFSEALEMIPDELGAEADIKSKLEVAASDDTDTSNFLVWLKREVTSRQQLGGKEFLHHLLKSGVADELSPSKQYTALVPTDEAFYAYYPIDWGFNPFLVESFLRRTLKEHLLEGDVALETLPDGEQLRTLAGTTLTVQRTDGGVTVAGIRVLTESEVLGPYGRIYAVPRLLHVTDQTVKLLREMHPHLERAPLLGSPWPMSQFLSHLLQRTEQAPAGGEATTLFAKYLALSHLSHLAPSSDEDFNQLEYTALVPTDASIMAALQQARRQASDSGDTAAAVEGEPVDPFLEDDAARNQLVGSHILKGRHSLSSLRPGTTVTTLLNDTLPVTAAQGGGVLVGGAELLPPGDSLYNLGAMFVVRGPLLLASEQTQHDQTPPRPQEPSESEPRVVTRTEVSVSRRVNDGALESVPALVAEMLAKRQR